MKHVQKQMRCVGVLVGLLAGSAAQAQVTGSGTSGTIPRWTGATSLGDSALFQSGSNLGIGTTSPASPLTIIGNTPLVLSVDNSATVANAYAVRGTITSSAAAGGSVGVRGINNATGSAGAGVYGSHGGSGFGVYGYAPSGRGVYGTSSTGTGVFGLHSSTSGTTPGVQGDSSSTADNAVGVLGRITSTTPGGSSAGVKGINNDANAGSIGVWGSHASNGWGVFGESISGHGVFGQSMTGIGVYARHESTSGGSPAILGSSSSTVDNATAVTGIISSLTPGMDSVAVRGINNGTGNNGIGVWGSQDGNGWGVYGETPNGVGVRGISGTDTGVYGSGEYAGIYGDSTDGVGVRGRSTNAPGVYGIGVEWGVYGDSTDGVGVYGLSTNSHGVYGSGGVYGVRGVSNTGAAIYGSSSNGYAGYFSGPVTVVGTLSKAAGSFKIDHPLDPANKYLSHSFVESPDMKNIYDGNITTDVEGNATVTLPDYFTALNTDYRYQLTCLGQFAQAIIAEKIKDNRFLIKTDKPNVEVSWQVTGIRSDAYAQAHRIQVEQDKGDDRGTYLHPELAGQPKAKGVAQSRLPGLRAGATGGSFGTPVVLKNTGE